MTSSSAPSDLYHEELHALFVIGTIASVAAFKTEIRVITFEGIRVGELLNVLVSFWTVYVLLMAVGFSDLPSILARASANLGGLFFILGIVFTATILGFGVTLWLYYSAPLWQRIAAVVVVILVIVDLILRRRGHLRPKAAKRQPKHPI